MGLKQDLHYLTVTWRGKNSRWAPKKNWKKNTPKSYQWYVYIFINFCAI